MGDEVKGFVESLMDFSFSEFLTTRLIKVLYIVAIICAGLSACGIILGGVFSGGFLSVVGGIIMGPIVFVLAVLSSRVSLELIVVIFRIAENTALIAKEAEGDVESLDNSGSDSSKDGSSDNEDKDEKSDDDNEDEKKDAEDDD